MSMKWRMPAEATDWMRLPRAVWRDLEWTETGDTDGNYILGSAGSTFFIHCKNTHKRPNEQLGSGGIQSKRFSNMSFIYIFKVYIFEV